MAGRRNTKVRMPKNPFGSPKKIMKRGLYEVMWHTASAGARAGAKPRDYGKKVRSK